MKFRIYEKDNQWWVVDGDTGRHLPEPYDEDEFSLPELLYEYCCEHFSDRSPWVNREDYGENIVWPIIPCPTIEVNENGGKQSRIGCRLDLTPPIAMRIVGKVLKKGEHYGEGNWRKIPAKDHLNHAMDHIYAFLAELVLTGNFSDEDADNATCRILFWREMLELERQKQPPKKEE